MMDGTALTRVSVFDTIDSTNDEVRRRIAAGETQAFSIAAREQTQGRGRSGRSWTSRPGNLAASFFLPFEGSHQEAARLSFATSLAVADTIAVFAGKADIRIKWPNDVLLNGGKVSGILLENLSNAPDGSLRLIIGIGINLAFHPDPAESNWPPTSVAADTGTAPDFDTALVVLTRQLIRRIAEEEQHGFSRTRAEWLARAARLGETISARLPNETWMGVFRDLDENGALVLETETGIRTITAGDVFFPRDAECC